MSQNRLPRCYRCNTHYRQANIPGQYRCPSCGDTFERLGMSESLLPKYFGKADDPRCPCCSGPLMGTLVPSTFKGAEYMAICPDHLLTDRAALLFYPTSEPDHPHLSFWLRDVPDGLTPDEYAAAEMSRHVAICNAVHSTKH